MITRKPSLRPELLLTLPVLLLAFSRMLPHPPNVTAIGAAALMAGTYFANPVAGLAVTLGSMLLSDAFLGFHATMPFVYLALALMIPMGRRLTGRVTPLAVAGTSLMASFMFFVITNVGVWLMYDMYPHTAGGLAACFVAAIPFFGYSAAGDLFFTALLFAGMEAAAAKFPVLSPVSQRPK